MFSQNEEVEMDEIINDIETEISDDEILTNENHLFIEDSGEIPLTVRRVLIQLLTGPFIDGKRHPKNWQILINHEKVIRSRLYELFLELIIDDEQQVAFLRQVNTDEIETPTLLRRTNLTFIDSVLMIHLRQILTESDTHGQRAVISINELVEQLLPYQQKNSTDQAGFRRRILAAIENARKRSILHMIRGSDGRFEISPTLKLLFSNEVLTALNSQYKNMINTLADEE